MLYHVTRRIKEFKGEYVRRRLWKRIVMALACIVVFGTVYALILPAITMEKSRDMENLNGDKALITDLAMQEVEGAWHGIKTGAALFDEGENADAPGNDSTAANNRIRTYDVATYTVLYGTGKQEGINNEFKEGRVFFEFILPLSEEQGCFEKEAMGWLKNTDTYEIKTDVLDLDGDGDKEVCQVLHGSFLKKPNESNPSAIGASHDEMEIAIRVLRMKNKEEVRPVFTYWLEYNEVGTQVENGIPLKIITGSEHECATHHRKEYKTVIPAPIVVSAAPRYNVALMQSNPARNSYRGSFDFRTGNDKALYQDAQTVEGRMMCYGITLQLVGKSQSHGLIGIELPEAGESLNFDLTLESKYNSAATGQEQDITADYAPLVWSAEGNSAKETQQDGRKVVMESDGIRYGERSAVNAAPYNRKTEDGNENPDFQSCYDGGDWTFQVDQTNPNIIHVSVTNFQINVDQFPQTVCEDTANSHVYYDPGENSGWRYYQIPCASFSAGEFWVVQPFYRTDESGEKHYITDELGTGSIAMIVSDSQLERVDAEGHKDTEKQVVTTDDFQRNTVAMESEGWTNSRIHYTKYQTMFNEQDKAIIEAGFREDDRDYITAGRQISLYHILENDSAEGIYTNVAYDMLVKFDDAFFNTDWIYPFVNRYYGGADHQQDVKVLFAVKPDGTGWSHNDKQGKQLKPDEVGYDDEMQRATADNLKFYNSKEAAKEHGVIVGVLVEIRGVATQGMNHIEVRIDGEVRGDCPTGYVYMLTMADRAWNKRDVTEAAREALGITEDRALTDEEYNHYAKTYMPSRERNETAGYETDYPPAYWRKEYGAEKTDGSGYTEESLGLMNSIKAAYGENGYIEGSGNKFFMDSCLVLEYVSKISKNTAQISADGTAKQNYDLNDNQRVVDYKLEPKIVYTMHSSEQSTLKTTVYVEDTLPESLHYIPNSSWWGGTYVPSPNQKQGSVEGGKSLTPEVTQNPDGTMTLRWELENVQVSQYYTGEESAAKKVEAALEPIWFSCEIGNKTNMEEDVRHGDQIVNTVKIWSDGEQKRAFEMETNNIAKVAINVSKLRGVSLTKAADQLLVDWWEPMGFSMNVGNNSANDLQNQVIVESLPYVGDGRGTRFDGALYVTEFSAGSLKAENQVLLRNNLTLYYTTNTEFRGKSSTAYVAERYDFSAHPDDWVKMEFSESQTIEGRPRGVCINLPENKQIVQVVAAGNLPAGLTLKMHITLELPDGKGGDYLVNQLSRGTLESTARTSVVSRILSGKTWLDGNYDGIQNDGENSLLNGVKVALLKRKKWDYGFEAEIGSSDVSYLNKAFDVYQYGPASGNLLQKTTGPVRPSDVDPNSWSPVGALKTYTYFTTQRYGNYARGGLKPTYISGKDGNGCTTLTYKEPMTEFEAEYEFYGAQSGKIGLVFGADKEEFPFSVANRDDYSGKGVMIDMESKDSVLFVAGTIEDQKVETSLTPSDEWVNRYNYNYTYSKNVPYVGAWYMLGNSDSMPTYYKDTWDQLPADAVTATICVKVSGGKVTVYAKGHEDRTLTITLADSYVGGYVSLFSTNANDGGAFKSFRIRNLSSERAAYDETLYEPVCYLGTETPIVIETGQEISVRAVNGDAVTSYPKAGGYRFTDLSAGTYAVRFTDGSGQTKISQLLASPADQGGDDALDSDGIPIYSEDHFRLERSMVLGIEMPEVQEMYTVLYESKDHDSGFYERGTELPRTGGSGNLLYTISGVAIMGGSLLYYISKKGKRKEGRKL